MYSYDYLFHVLIGYLILNALYGLNSFFISVSFYQNWIFVHKLVLSSRKDAQNRPIIWSFELSAVIWLAQ